jgi:hypothetical protein
MFAEKVFKLIIDRLTANLIGGMAVSNRLHLIRFEQSSFKSD